MPKNYDDNFGFGDLGSGGKDLEMEDVLERELEEALEDEAVESVGDAVFGLEEDEILVSKPQFSGGDSVGEDGERVGGGGSGGAFDKPPVGLGFAGKLSDDDAKLFGLIPHGAKILFAHPKNYESLSYLIGQKKVDLFVADVDPLRAVDVNRMGGVFLQGDIFKMASIINKQEFDFVVMDESLLLYNDVAAALGCAISIGACCLASVRNRAKWKDRVRFLLSGRFVDADGGEKWYRRGFAHSCNAQEFIEMCVDNKTVVERACFYDANLDVHSIYSFLKFPALKADKFFFVVRRLGL